MIVSENLAAAQQAAKLPEKLRHAQSCLAEAEANLEAAKQAATGAEDADAASEEVVRREGIAARWAADVESLEAQLKQARAATHPPEDAEAAAVESDPASEEADPPKVPVEANVPVAPVGDGGSTDA